MLRHRSLSVKGFTADELRGEKIDTLFLVWLVSRSTGDLLDRGLAPAGLTADDFAIYSLLAAAPGLTPTELARWMAAPPTTVSSYVRRFEHRGHLARSPHPEDGRSYQLRLTAAGRRAHKHAVALFSPLRRRVAEALADREQDTGEVLQVLRTVIDDIRSDADRRQIGSR